MTASSMYSQFGSDSFPMGDADPLSALHDHILATNPDMDMSMLTDDELIALLKSAKEPKDLSYLNLNLAKQTLNDGTTTMSINSPTLSSTSGSQFSTASTTSTGTSSQKGV